VSKKEKKKEKKRKKKKRKKDRKKGGKKNVAHITLHELVEINVPELKGHGVTKSLNSPLVNLVGLLEKLVLLQKQSVVHDDLRSSNLELQDAVVHRLAGVNSPRTLLEVGIKSPQFQGFEKAILDCLRLVKVRNALLPRCRGGSRHEVQSSLEVPR